MKKYILHHRDSDGFGAAWAASKKLGFKDVEYIDIDYGDPMPEMTPGAIVYMLDYTLKDIDGIKLLCSAHNSVIIIDHHIKSKVWIDINESELPENFFPSYNINKSGAVLAWEYFNPNTAVPILLKHVQDFDLWKHEIGGTREIGCLLYSIGFDFEEWDRINKELNNGSKEPYILGSAIVKYEDKLVDILASEAKVIEDADKVLKVTVNASSNVSVLGAELLKRYPEAQYVEMWHMSNNGLCKIALRSRMGGFDVGELAVKHGGGGHKPAAGYSIKLS